MPLFAHSRPGTTPLPVAQIAVLMTVRLAEPISYTVIFPFINQMVEELGVTDNPDKVGFYSGLVESVFAFVQFFTVYHWAKLSDQIGRKPVLVLGLTGVAISGALFGLSTSFWGMIFCRCLSGALNGNVAVVKASIGDITDETNSTEAFAMYGLTWTVGSIIGSAMGGVLSHPYERFPEWFGSWEVFQVHPYFLPCLVCALVTILGILFTLIFLHEPLSSLSLSSPSSSPSSSSSPYSSSPHRRSFTFSRLSFSLPSPFTRPGAGGGGNHKRHMSSASLVSDADTLVEEGAGDREGLLGKAGGGRVGGVGVNAGGGRGAGWSFKELMGFRKVRIMLSTVFLNSLVQGGWNSAVLLFFFDRNNGLSMSASSIGLTMALNGVWTVACQILFLTRLRRVFGITLAYKILSLGWPFVWILLPLLRGVLELTETPLEPAGKVGGFDQPAVYAETRGWMTQVAVAGYLMFVTFVGLSSSLLMVLVNFSSPDKTALGAINGLSTAAGCMARVIGPSSVSALFAISMDGQVLGGRLWWLVMTAVSVLNLGVCLMVEPDSRGGALGTGPLDTGVAVGEEEEDEGMEMEMGLGLRDSLEETERRAVAARE
ncbi:hypothetical protein IAT38_000429 [Cryptococcus sp. DSM 104549]